MYCPQHNNKFHWKYELKFILKWCLFNGTESYCSFTSLQNQSFDSICMCMSHTFQVPCIHLELNSPDFYFLFQSLITFEWEWCSCHTTRGPSIHHITGRNVVFVSLFALSSPLHSSHLGFHKTSRYWTNFCRTKHSSTLNYAKLMATERPFTSRKFGDNLLNRSSNNL